MIISRPRRIAAFVLSFSSFFVFPAMAIGNTTALAIPNFVTVALVTLLWSEFRGVDWSKFLLMMFPLLLSGLFTVGAGIAVDPGVVPKVGLVFAMSLLTMVPVSFFVRLGYGDDIVRGAGYAVVIHAGVAAYQVIEFARDEFPFAALLNTNVSMSMDENASRGYAEFVKRPFGLFAEPSAMAACVGPWVVIFAAALLGSRLRPAFSRSRRLLSVALLAGLSLVALSQSGQGLGIIAAVAVIAAIPKVPRGESRAAMPIQIIVLVVVMSFIALYWATSEQRFAISDNRSWELRMLSLLAAPSALATDPARAIFGVGPGQSFVEINTAASFARLSGEGVSAVWSIAFAYAMETGLIGVCCLLMVFVEMIRIVFRSRARLTGSLCLLVWLVGVVLGTSYPQQPSLWLTMALLLQWDAFTGSGVEGVAAGSVPRMMPT